jgi:hypothetical protein
MLFSYVYNYKKLITLNFDYYISGNSNEVNRSVNVLILWINAFLTVPKIRVDIHYNGVSLGTGSLCDAQEEHHPPRQVARLLRQNGHRDPDRLPRTLTDCARFLQPPHRHGPQNDRLGSAASAASSHRR